uniref:Uncharacterized protein n=1 Tax=Timema shepardi TaxID=629360 RepID=A0A7R9FXC6_TIMSH|nr:unnamed protein product [Timema shepardi]
MAQLIRDIIHGYHDVMDNKSGYYNCEARLIGEGREGFRCITSRHLGANWLCLAVTVVVYMECGVMVVRRPERPPHCNMPSSSVELSTTSALDNYATEADHFLLNYRVYYKAEWSDFLATDKEVLPDFSVNHRVLDGVNSTS